MTFVIDRQQSFDVGHTVDSCRNSHLKHTKARI